MTSTTVIKRKLKNAVNNYTEAEKLVREATSNDAWGPSTSLMAQIADLTYNHLAYNEIMHMLWRRLNDKNKNWRHVYKSLQLLEYLVKHGANRVIKDCQHNMHSIETLKDFQFFDQCKDNGLSVREKAKKLVQLLKNEDVLDSERTKAVTARERILHNNPMSANYRKSKDAYPAGGLYHSSSLSHLSNIDNNLDFNSPYSKPDPVVYHSEAPKTKDEEDIQLQIALAESREEEAQKAKEAHKEDLKLRMAIEESCKEEKRAAARRRSQSIGQPSPYPVSNSFDIMGELADLDLNAATESRGGRNQYDTFGGAWPESAAPMAASGTANIMDSLLSPRKSITAADPWDKFSSSMGTTSATKPIAVSNPNTGLHDFMDPWGNFMEDAPESNRVSRPPMTNDLLSSRKKSESMGSLLLSTAGADMDSRSESNYASYDLMGDTDVKSKRKSPSEFLGANADLVNLDNLVPKAISGVPASTNPFSTGPSAVHSTGLEERKSEPIGQMMPAFSNMNSMQTMPPLFPQSMHPMMAHPNNYQQQPASSYQQPPYSAFNQPMSMPEHMSMYNNNSQQMYRGQPQQQLQYNANPFQ